MGTLIKNELRQVIARFVTNTLVLLLQEMDKKTLELIMSR